MLNVIVTFIISYCNFIIYFHLLIYVTGNHLLSDKILYVKNFIENFIFHIYIIFMRNKDIEIHSLYYYIGGLSDFFIRILIFYKN